MTPFDFASLTYFTEPGFVSANYGFVSAKPNDSAMIAAKGIKHKSF